MLLEEALTGNGVNPVYSPMHLVLMDILFPQIGKTNNIPVHKDSFSSIGDKLNFIITFGLNESFVRNTYGIIQLGAIAILQYCCLFVLVSAKG
jgi:hypothetical protein